jgi:hypothetical protein
MARKVFFSFHFAKDAWKVGQIRNADVVKNNFERSQYLDKAEWEKIERSGDRAIQNWIDAQMAGTSVTAVLIGGETYSRKWVLYEIEKSHKEGKGLLGIRMTGMKESDQSIDSSVGLNPFEYAKIADQFGRRPDYPIYNWERDNGRSNMSSWIERAAKAAGR